MLAHGRETVSAQCLELLVDTPASGERAMSGEHPVSS
jgi:hypothetical protein